MKTSPFDILLAFFAGAFVGMAVAWQSPDLKYALSMVFFYGGAAIFARLSFADTMK